MLHKLFSRTLLTLFVATVYSCSNENVDVIREYDETNTPYLTNHPLPKNASTLRVLAIGNSYTIDGTAYLPEILDSLGIDANCYGVYTLVAAGASLQYWDEVLQYHNPVKLIRRAGLLNVEVTSGSMVEILSQPWDIIVFQQVSYLSMSYDSFYPHLHHLIDAAKRYCTNENVTLAWHMTHSYASTYIRGNGVPSVIRWQSIANATRMMMRFDGIDVIIPMGTAIENARHSTLQNDTELTRDGTHLAFGVSRYIAACAWVETLFAPVFGFSVSNLTATHDLEEWEEFGIGVDAFIPGSSEAVTDNNRFLCIQCVNMASHHPYSIVNH
ncbi:MAG: DUF4886 domain-containing protein [Bacteroidales bacterium]|nr:DUF4886 domain-containing protein [Bacteroidales bacterium]